MIASSSRGYILIALSSRGYVDCLIFWRIVSMYLVDCWLIWYHHHRSSTLYTILRSVAQSATLNTECARPKAVHIICLQWSRPVHCCVIHLNCPENITLGVLQIAMVGAPTIIVSSTTTSTFSLESVAARNNISPDPLDIPIKVSVCICCVLSRLHIYLVSHVA